MREKFSVIVPIYNGRENIEPLFDALWQAAYSESQCKALYIVRKTWNWNGKISSRRAAS